MNHAARLASPTTAALIGLVGLASAMGVGRFAFTPMLPLMQQAGTLSLAQGGSLARANYLGYLVGAVLCMAVNPPPGRAARLALAAVALLTAAMGVTTSFPLWTTLRFLAGMASAFVLVGVSSWALPILAACGRAGWAGFVYTGVGTGIFACGLVGLGAGVRNVSPDTTWLLLGACSAVVAIVCWRTLGSEGSTAVPAPDARRAPLPTSTWWMVMAYGAFGFGYIVPATFLPAAARQVVPDPAIFAWTWPVFGLAAALSTAAAARWWRNVPPRRLWTGAQIVMAAGVLGPAAKMSVPTLLWCAGCVGGTFMVVTMAGIQEARRVASASAPRLIAAMTAAFAVGQLVGPYTVTAFSSSAADVGLPHLIAAAVLLLGLGALFLGRALSPAIPPSPQPGERP